MADRIYLIDSGENLTPMENAPYDSEALLQKLLASYPNLLAGEQVDPGNPRRWLLVMKELDVPGEEDGKGRWALDHLFLDQDAVPTLVEVKRSLDTRIRREVVGQMLDYAANALSYIPAERIRSRFEARCEQEGFDHNVVLLRHISGGGVGIGDEDTDFAEESVVEAFWTDMRTNLQAGRIRLVFVADIIPPELKRVIEFLNEQMDPAEVLGVEIKQYKNESSRILVPSVVGRTEAAGAKKGSERGMGQYDLNLSEFMRLVEGQLGEEVARLAHDIVDLCARFGGSAQFTRGAKVPKCNLMFGIGGRSGLGCWIRLREEKKDCLFRLNLRHLSNHEPFRDQQIWEDVRGRFESLEGWRGGNDWKGFPYCDLGMVIEAGQVDELKGAIRYFCDALARGR